MLYATLLNGWGENSVNLKEEFRWVDHIDKFPLNWQRNFYLKQLSTWIASGIVVVFYSRSNTKGFPKFFFHLFKETSVEFHFIHSSEKLCEMG